MTPSLTLLLFFPIAVWIVGSIPAYVVGSRLGVVHPGEAFIPVVGPYIVLLHSVKRSGWLCILGLIPLLSFVFYLWLILVIPTEHRRTAWWTLAFLIPGVNVVAYFAYAFTLDPYGVSGPSGGLGSTYHVPPGYGQRP
ncbi:MAG TPA: hypothetical protein VMU72_01370 [Gaiellaceae bacterium]|nr:hypothetical protein [Gaiellaceae bacterium]